MQSQLFTIILLGAGLFIFDQYLYNGFIAAFKNKRIVGHKFFRPAYTLLSLVIIIGTICGIYVNLPVGVRGGFFNVVFCADDS